MFRKLLYRLSYLQGYALGILNAVAVAVLWHLAFRSEGTATPNMFNVAAAVTMVSIFPFIYIDWRSSEFTKGWSLPLQGLAVLAVMALVGYLLNISLAILGAVTIASYLVWYSTQIWKGKKRPQNPASWSMWLVMDTIVLITTYLAGESIWLALAYVVGCAPVAAVNLKRGEWKWRGREWFSSILAIITCYLWLTSGAEWGMVAGAVAMTAAGIPLYIDLMGEPDKDSFPIWVVTAYACICTLIPAGWVVASGTALAWGSFLFNGSLSFVVLRELRYGPSYK